MTTNGFKVKTENDCFIVICSRCRQNLKFGDFTLLFRGVRQRNARKIRAARATTCNTIIFTFLTNHILALWRCRSVAASSLLKLPNFGQTAQRRNTIC